MGPLEAIEARPTGQPQPEWEPKADGAKYADWSLSTLYRTKSTLDSTSDIITNIFPIFCYVTGGLTIG